jgi:hypothetical protein
MEGGCGRNWSGTQTQTHNLAAGPGREPEEEEEDPESPFLYKYFPGPPTLSSMGTKEKEKKKREGNTAHGNSLAVYIYSNSPGKVSKQLIFLLASFLPSSIHIHIASWGFAW